MTPDQPPGGVPPQQSGLPPLRSTGGAAAWNPPSVEQLQCLLVNYEIIDIIGQGGMGAVYVGRQLSLDRLVAIKILPKEALNQAGSEDAVDRFKNEARSMARMNHPGIVGVYDFGETPDDQFYLVMEHVNGTDVAQMILSQGRLPDGHALSITAHVCDALHYAHSHGVIHRDIKPANILLNKEGQVKIADFGLAKRTGSGSRGITRTNMTMGTPDFIAPEALIEGLTVDHRSDIYSVGVMLYNMLTGEVPRGMFKMPSAKVGSDPRFDAIVLKAIQAEREERYQTVQDMRRDLDVILTIPMAKMEKTGRAPVHTQGITSRVASRPVANASRKVPTGPASAPSTGSKPRTGDVRIVTSAPPAGAAQGLRGVSPSVEVPVRGAPSQRRAAVRNPAVLAGGIAAVVAVLGGGWWLMTTGARKPAPSPPSGSAGVGDVAGSQRKPSSPPPSGGGGVLPSNFTELREVPRNRWFKILSSREAVVKRKNVEWQDGWVRCRGDNEFLGFTDLGGSHHVRDIAVKCVVRPPEAGKAWTWTFREGAHGSYRLVVRADKLELNYDDRSGGTGRMIHLREGSFSKEVANAPQWSLEATVHGERFKVSLNNREIFSQDKLRLLEAGSCWLRAGGSGSVILKDLSFKILDDAAAPSIATGADSPPAGVLTFGNRRYQFVPGKLRWNEAKARAESMGGHLATITSREEDEWVSATFVKWLPGGLGLWLGGTSAGTPSEWRWITGEGFSFKNWSPGEPNRKIEEIGLMLRRNESGQIGWADFRDDGVGFGDRRGGFLVEWDDKKVVPGESTISPSPQKWTNVTAEATSSTAAFKSAKFEDVAGKLRFQGGDGAQLHLRAQPPRFYRAMRTRDRLYIELFDSAANKAVRQLAILDHLPALRDGPEHEMVFAARGDLLAVWVDGKFSGSAKDGDLRSGAVGYFLPGGRRLKSLEFADLGGGDGGAALASAGTPGKPAEKPAGPAAPVAPVKPAGAASDFEKRLADIELQFKTAYDRDIAKAHAASVLDLDAKYQAALDRALAATVKEGRAEESLKLREEKQRLNEKRPLPPVEADSSAPGSLKQLRGTYRSTLLRMESERDRKARPYYDRYDQLLEAYQKELTQQQKYDDAIRVKSLRVEWSAKHPKGEGGRPQG